MKLKPRLLEIANLINPNSKVIDVGADHAFLDIYLSKQKNCTCLALDISENCIKIAIKNIIKYSANVLVKVNDGLKNINLNDEIIVISGMGTRTIKKILGRKIKNDLIISTHTNLDELKEFLEEINYKIVIEKEVIDKKKYTIIYAKTTN